MTKKKAAAKAVPAPKPRKKPAGKPTQAKRKANPMSNGKGVTRTKDGLQPNQVQVLCALLQGKSQVEAAAAGGVSESGVKYMLSIAAFKKAYEDALDNIRTVARLDAEKLLEGLRDFLAVSVRDFHRPDGSVRPMSEWSEAMGRAVASFDTEEIWAGTRDQRVVIGAVTRVRLWPRMEATDKAAKIIGAYKPTKVEHSGRVDGMAELLQSIDGSDVGTGPAGKG